MKNAILKASWLLAIGLFLTIAAAGQSTKKPPATGTPGSGVGGTTGGGTGVGTRCRNRNLFGPGEEYLTSKENV